MQAFESLYVNVTNLNVQNYDAGSSLVGIGQTSSGAVLHCYLANWEIANVSTEYLIYPRSLNSSVDFLMVIDSISYVNSTASFFYGTNAGSYALSNLYFENIIIGGLTNFILFEHYNPFTVLVSNITLQRYRPLFTFILPPSY